MIQNHPFLSQKLKKFPGWRQESQKVTIISDFGSTPKSPESQKVTIIKNDYYFHTDGKFSQKRVVSLIFLCV